MDRPPQMIPAHPGFFTLSYTLGKPNGEDAPWRVELIRAPVLAWWISVDRADVTPICIHGLDSDPIEQPDKRVVSSREDGNVFPEYENAEAYRENLQATYDRQDAAQRERIRAERLRRVGAQ